MRRFGWIGKGERRRDGAVRLNVESLESREMLDATPVLAAGVLTITGSEGRDAISVRLDAGADEIVVSDGTTETGRFASAAVLMLDIDGLAGADVIRVEREVLQGAMIDGGDGPDRIFAGGGTSLIDGGAGDDRIFGGPGNDVLDGGPGNDRITDDEGINLLRGQEGKDKLTGGADRELLIGGPGKDLVFANGGADTLFGGDGRDFLSGGDGADQLSGDAGNDVLFSGLGNDSLSGGAGVNRQIGGGGTDSDLDAGGTLSDDAIATALAIEASIAARLPAAPVETLTATEVEILLDRASAATASDDAIIAIVDRNGQVLGVRVEAGVSPTITGDPGLLVFAVDGALAKARSTAFFANDTGPLTSRTVGFLSQTTITEREVNSNPSITDPDSPFRGPGFVAPIRLGANFPPGVDFTPPVDLFGIEHINRDSILHPGPDQIKGTGDDYDLSMVNPAIDRPLGGGRNNADLRFVPPGKELLIPESFGFTSGLNVGAQSRGIATLPGGIPIYRDGVLLGGIGVFFPGETGYASEENSSLGNDFDPTMPDRTLEAEYIGFAAVGGSSGIDFPIEEIAGIAKPAGFDLPAGRIDLVGITLDLVGPGGLEGPERIVALGRELGEGVSSGADLLVDGVSMYLDGRPVPEGWLVFPHDGVGLTANDVNRIVLQGLEEALITRSAIRLPLDSPTRMIIAVTDSTGEILGLFRMPDGLFDAIDVTVAKARNAYYFADPALLAAEDSIPGVAADAALTGRTVRFVSEPRYPDGILGTPPGPFSILTDGGVDPTTGLEVGAPLPASAFDSLLGFDAFNPGTIGRRGGASIEDIINQNGVIFFPGMVPLYKDLDGDGVVELVGGVGASGDGVDQNDIVTAASARGYETPQELRADEFFFREVRLPYLKFNRTPRL